MWQPDIRAAFASFPFDAPFPDPFPTQMHKQGEWSNPEWIATHMEEFGFENVEVKVVLPVIHEVHDMLGMRQGLQDASFAQLEVPVLGAIVGVSALLDRVHLILGRSVVRCGAGRCICAGGKSPALAVVS